MNTSPVSSTGIAGVERVTSLGSIWEFDSVLGRYRRYPRHETPRERPEWGDESAGLLQDHVWHPLKQWWISDDGDRLIVIPAGDGWRPIVAPMHEGALTTPGDLAVELAAHDIAWGSWNPPAP